MNEANHGSDAGSEGGTYTVQHNWGGDRTISNAVVSLIADLEDVRAIDLEPLHSTVDPDALDRIFTPTDTGNQRTSGHVSFVFGGYHVTVYGDGEIAVSELRHRR